MRLIPFFSVLVSVCAVSARRSPQHVGRDIASKLPQAARDYNFAPSRANRVTPSRSGTLQYLNANTSKFAVDGTAIPDVDFDIGESYAGLLPISSDPDETRELYFWFFPSENPAASDEITIWLNGGPGCSSLEGLLQENGPFIWQYGTLKPVPNPYTWVNLTNMVWVEQPVGTGFSQGVPNADNETIVAQQFMGFFKNFVDTFSLQDRKVFIAGESYAGQYVPYIASEMLDANDTEYFNVDSIMIYDPVLTNGQLQNQGMSSPIPAAAFANYYENLLYLNQSYLGQINDLSSSCGYSDYLEKYLTYPPPGPLPAPKRSGGCDVFDMVFNAALDMNPCFDIYAIATTCPLLWDVLGFPGSFDYLPDGATIYFNRTDVQKAINAPIQAWSECSNGVLDTDTSPGSADSVLPGVIERTSHTIIGHGMLDMVLIMNGTLLSIQNMTWAGQQGFQSPPADDFYVPFHSESSLSTLAGSGSFGKTHTERGLTFVSVALSGHMVPQYAPAAAYRQMEFMLGRIDSLTSTVPFTTQS